MLYEQYPSLGLIQPSNNDGGIDKFESSSSSLDFYLLDDIDTYLPPLHSEKPKNDLINDSINDNSLYQLPEDFFSDIDLSDLNSYNEASNAVSIDEIDIEKWINQASFPSPPMETTNSSDSLSWFNEQYPINTDMIVPASPPSSSSSSSSSSSLSSPSSISSSPAPSLKRPKLTTVERKMRKKGQNKTAAEKYRVKKKSERTELLERQATLKLRNKELKSELDDLTYRVEQFKQLFTEFIQAN